MSWEEVAKEMEGVEGVISMMEEAIEEDEEGKKDDNDGEQDDSVKEEERGLQSLLLSEILQFRTSQLRRVKVGVLLFVMMWIRWTLPRFRFDQLMTLAWRQMIPICLGILTTTGLVIYFKLPLWWHPVADVGVFGLAMIVDPMLPAGPNPNRRVPLEGSRFCPPPPHASGSESEEAMASVSHA